MRIALDKSLLILFVTALAGCSSGGNPNAGAFADANAATLDLFEEVAGLGISDVASLPTSGTASYSGYLGIENTAFGGVILGDMAMSVNFATERINGSATNFVNDQDVRYMGALSIGNGDFDRTADPATEWQFEADIGGTLSAAGQSHSVDADLFGDFAGPNQEGVIGILTGSITSSGSGTSIIVPGDAAFAAERQ